MLRVALALSIALIAGTAVAQEIDPDGYVVDCYTKGCALKQWKAWRSDPQNWASKAIEREEWKLLQKHIQKCCEL
jgi:hypothetical protein